MGLTRSCSAPLLETDSMANTLKQMLPPDVVRGPHTRCPIRLAWHAVDPGLAGTLPGGPQANTFRLPSGSCSSRTSAARTRHSLYINGGRQKRTYGAGEHVHTVTLGRLGHPDRIDALALPRINLKPERGMVRLMCVLMGSAATASCCRMVPSSCP